MMLCHGTATFLFETSQTSSDPVVTSLPVHMHVNGCDQQWRIWGKGIGSCPLWQKKITIGKNMKIWFAPFCVSTSGERKFSPHFWNPKIRHRWSMTIYMLHVMLVSWRQVCNCCSHSCTSWKKTDQTRQRKDWMRSDIYFILFISHKHIEQSLSYDTIKSRIWACIIAYISPYTIDIIHDFKLFGRSGQIWPRFLIWSTYRLSWWIVSLCN